MTDMDKVEGKIWSAIRSGLNLAADQLQTAHEAQSYEPTSAHLDEASRMIADKVIEEAGIESLASQIREMREALEPFAEQVGRFGRGNEARKVELVLSDRDAYPHEISVAKFERARSALGGE